nr:ATP-binding protein [Roseibaca domitiana]
MQVAPGVPRDLRLREGQLERVLDNILGNALDYGKQARVAMFTHAASLVITIEDDGPGIAPADRQRAREPFVRLDSARNLDVGAHVGLGLAIADDVMRVHGGRLELDDSPALGGLLVRLILPLSRQA